MIKKEKKKRKIRPTDKTLRGRRLFLHLPRIFLLEIDVFPLSIAKASLHQSVEEELDINLTDVSCPLQTIKEWRQTANRTIEIAVQLRKPSQSV